MNSEMRKRSLTSYRISSFLIDDSFVAHIAFVAQNHFLHIFVCMLERMNGIRQIKRRLMGS